MGSPRWNLRHVRLCARRVREPPFEYCLDVSSRRGSRRLPSNKKAEVVEDEVKSGVFKREHCKGMWWVVANKDRGATSRKSSLRHVQLNQKRSIFPNKVGVLAKLRLPRRVQYTQGFSRSDWQQLNASCLRLLASEAFRLSGPSPLYNPT